MKKNTSRISPEESTAGLAHLAWCALIALRITQQEGNALSPLTVHTFLLRWLATAQKQRRFTRLVASDIDILLRLGRLKGPGANLHQRLNDIWVLYSHTISRQSDLFRLALGIDALKSAGWKNVIVNDDEWEPTALQIEYTGSFALLVKQSDLTDGFTEAGELLRPINFLSTAETSPIVEVFNRQRLQHVQVSFERGLWGIRLTPEPMILEKQD